jgi:hypothetical protein
MKTDTAAVGWVVVDPHLLEQLTVGVLAHDHPPTSVQINPNELLSVIL